MHSTFRPDMLAIARWCAAAGWPVHPLAAGRKTPVRNCPACAEPGHVHLGCPCIPAGRWCHGFHAATTDPGRISARWGHDQRSGVGVSCGPAGLVVIDIDAHAVPLPERGRLLPGIPVHDGVDLTGLENGFHSLALLAALRREPDPAADPATLRVRTPSGGMHVWYRAGAGRNWLCSTGSGRGRALAWQVDVRATGGYIVAPGTTTTAGTYTPVGDCRTPAPLPAWLAGELTRTGHLNTPAPTAPSHRTPPSRARQAVAAAGGGRTAAARVLESVLADVATCSAVEQGAGFTAKLNRAAFTLGGLVAAGHLSHHTAHDTLLAVAEHVRPGRHTRAATIVRNGLDAGTRRPLYPGGRS
ncbi:bifunctional DNA primase/polymerase [Streptomyces sp. NPDC059651]|uniref:bifunctional DNA primase/polymerase n=1 Tax=unclassified Streptomyces TaxID=2593676 RepID=UPI0036C43942